MNQTPALSTTPPPDHTDRPPRHHFGVIAGFWLGVVLVMLLLCGIQTYQSQPALARSWNGLATALLMLAYATWFLVSMRLWGRRHGPGQWRLTWRETYPELLTGLALTVALVLLHHAFIALIYAYIGAMFQRVIWQNSIFSLLVIVPLYLFADGTLASGRPEQIGSDLFTLLVCIGLSYSIGEVQEGQFRDGRRIVELRAAQRQLELAAARDVELAALRERNRLAREMHDSLGHALVLIAIKIEAAQRLQAIDSGRATAELDDTKALVRATMGELRSSLAGLRPPALDGRSFRAVLTELAADLGRRANVDVSTTIADEADALERSVQEALYRVAQEGLANVAKHARARHAALTLALVDSAAWLEVADDGIGLDAAPRPDGAHYGIVGMRERVDALGGTLALGQRPGSGTLLRVRIPLKEEIGVRDPDPVG